MHNNFFEELEEEVSAFTKENRLSTSSSISSETLMRVLQRKYKYKIEQDGLSEYEELKSLRSVFVPKRKRLLLNYDLNDSQKAFVLGKEFFRTSIFLILIVSEFKLYEFLNSI